MIDLKLRELDSYCLAKCSTFASLHPSRPTPRTYRENFKLLFQQQPKPSAFLDALAESCYAIVDATLLHFPENIFWDFDGLFAELYFSKDRHKLETTTTTIVKLFAGYGINSVICFRYTHDFIYGFDWARWVAKDPATRSSIPPYGESFLAYLVQRMQELEELIARDDEKYHQLPAGTVRNPYTFNRSPAHEAERLRELARTGGIPVPAWSLIETA